MLSCISVGRAGTLVSRTCCWMNSASRWPMVLINLCNRAGSWYGGQYSSLASARSPIEARGINGAGLVVVLGQGHLRYAQELGFHLPRLAEDFVGRCERWTVCFWHRELAALLQGWRCLPLGHVAGHDYDGCLCCSKPSPWWRPKFVLHCLGVESSLSCPAWAGVCHVVRFLVLQWPWRASVYIPWGSAAKNVMRSSIALPAGFSLERNRILALVLQVSQTIKRVTLQVLPAPKTPWMFRALRPVSKLRDTLLRTATKWPEPALAMSIMCCARRMSGGLRFGLSSKRISVSCRKDKSISSWCGSGAGAIGLLTGMPSVRGLWCWCVLRTIPSSALEACIAKAAMLYMLQ